MFVAGFLGSPRMNFIQGKVLSVTGEHGEIELHGGQRPATDFPVPLRPGEAVTLGICPEDLVLVDPAEAILSGEVHIAEQLGGETYVYVTLPHGDNVTVEIKGQAMVEPGETLHLGFAGGKFHVFGADEKVIRHT